MDRGAKKKKIHFFGQKKKSGHQDDPGVSGHSFAPIPIQASSCSERDDEVCNIQLQAPATTSSSSYVPWRPISFSPHPSSSQFPSGSSYDLPGSSRESYEGSQHQGTHSAAESLYFPSTSSQGIEETYGAGAMAGEAGLGWPEEEHHTQTSTVAGEEFDSLSQSKPHRKVQTCRMCSNHKILVPMKGHKGECPFRKCNCYPCHITRKNQHFSRKRQRLTRIQQHDLRESGSHTESGIDISGGLDSDFPRMQELVDQTENILDYTLFDEVSKYCKGGYQSESD